jgi:hypothetical protein
MNIARNRGFPASVHRTAPWVTAVVAGIGWALCLAYAKGAESEFSSAMYLFEQNPAARVLTVSGRASAHWNGRSRPLEPGIGLADGEVVVTGTNSTVMVRTASGDEIEIFPSSRMSFRGSQWMWLDQADRWLNGIRMRFQRLGGPQPSDRISCPAAVISVRAGSCFPAVHGVAVSDEHWLGTRRV